MPKYLKELQRFYRKYHRMPSYSEAMDITGLKSKSSIYKLINRLREQGFVDKDRSGRIIPKRLFGDVPVLGTIEAGFPSPAEEELVDTMTLDEYLITNREATFMLTVSGDSMKDAGIIAGDLVLVERGVDPKDGDIVIAEVDGNWTMKYLRKSRGKISLVAANAKYKPIEPTDELRIAAVVKAVVRKY